MIKSADADNLSETVSVNGSSKGCTRHDQYASILVQCKLHCVTNSSYIFGSKPISRLFVDPKF